MKHFILFISLMAGLSSLQAQTYFGFQTLGKNTIFLSLTWQGEPQLGLGYNTRGFGTTFTDVQAEVRFPLAHLYDLDHVKVVTGVYKPFVLGRSFVAGGLHLRWEREKIEEEQSSRLSLAASVLPTLYYGSTLVTDKAFGTAALRITYAPVIVAHRGGSSTFFTDHKLEVGGHLDMHIERSLSIGLDGYFSKQFGSKKSLFEYDDGIELEGNLYIGLNYSLYRL
ncbi:MAG: hypothetical protein AB8F95_08890 [Bacteroidia bacterium]